MTVGKFAKFATGFGLAGVVWVSPAAAQSPPSLGTAQGFAVLAGSAVTNTGPTVIRGDVGVQPGAAVTGFPPGVLVGGTIHSADAAALQAQNDAGLAYTNLVGQPCDTDLTGQDLGGLVLPAGVYCYAASAQLTGTLTLDAQGDANAVFIIKTGSTLTTASNAVVLVINGGERCRVFWQVGSSATLGTNTTFAGNILALTSITLTTGVQMVGRALARNGAVTLDSNAIDATACAAPGCPVVSIAPTTLPAATQGIAYDQQLTGSGGAGPYTFTLAAGTVPAGLALSASGRLSGTPTAAGTSALNLRATDVNGCLQEQVYAFVVLSPVPTLAQWAMILLTGLLSLAGFAALRTKARAR